MKFEKQYSVRIKDIGVGGKMTNYAFLSFMEEIASLHSETVGFGVKDIETKKKVWILMDWKLKVLDRPEYSENLDIKTWARKNEKVRFYTYRDFEVYCKGKKVAIATSKWVMIDLNENKIIKITDDIISLYKPEDERVFEEKEIEKLREEQEADNIIEYQVRRADIDVNHHMHNLNYLTLAYEALPDEIYNEGEKNNVRIMYKHQIFLGNKVKCKYKNKEGTNIITIKSEDESVWHASIELS